MLTPVERLESFAPAKDPSRTEGALRQAFEKTIDTPFVLEELQLDNPQQLFLPVSVANQIRRDALATLEQQISAARSAWREHLQSRLEPDAEAVAVRSPARWIIKADRPEYFDGFDSSDLAGMADILLDISLTPIDQLIEWGAKLAGKIDRQRIRFALPMIARDREPDDMLAKISALRERGWHRWEVSNLYAWKLLGLDPHSGQPDCYPLDVTADWPIYVLNRVAAAQVFEMGVGRITLSPEDQPANQRALAERLGAKACVIIRQDMPLFISESCAYANLIGGCPGKKQCRFEQMDLISAKGESIHAVDRQCRTVVLEKTARVDSDRLSDLAGTGVLLRADFLHRRYDPATVPTLWRQLVRQQP